MAPQTAFSAAAAAASNPVAIPQTAFSAAAAMAAESPPMASKPLGILKQAPSTPGGLKLSTPTMNASAAANLAALGGKSTFATDPNKEEERQLEQEKREAEDKERMEMMLQETQKRLEDEKKKAQMMEAAADDRKRAKEQAEREAQANQERRLKAEADREVAERKKLEQLKTEEEQRKYREQQEREAVEKAKMEQKLRDLERKLEEERERTRRFEEEEKKQREQQEQQRLQRQREFEDQQRLFREQEAAERKRFEEEKERLRREIEEEKKKMEDTIRQKTQSEIEKVRKEQDEKVKLEEKMARQEQDRQKATKEAEEKRVMQQRLLDAEASLQREKKRTEEMEQAKQLQEVERQLEEERKRMEQLMLDLADFGSDIPAVPAPANPVPPKDSLVKQRRLSTFIENIDLPAPPSAPPKLPPVPKFPGGGAKFPGGAALPPPIANLPPPPPLAGALPARPGVPNATKPALGSGGLPPPPAGAAFPAAVPAVSSATKPSVMKPAVAMAPPSNLPPPSVRPPPVAFPPPSTKPKINVSGKGDLVRMIEDLGQKTDTHFNLFLQAGRERNLNVFIDQMKESTGCVREILSLASSVQSVDSLQAKLSTQMNNLSTSLKSLLLCAKTLANAIEQGQQTIALLLSLEKIASEVLITKYDILDYLNTNGAAFFGFVNPMKEVYEGMGVRLQPNSFFFFLLFFFFFFRASFSLFSVCVQKKMEEHVDTITQSIKFLATVARSQNQPQYQDAAGAVISGASEMRNFLSDEMLKSSDFTFKQTLNATLMQLSDSLSLLIQSSNNASRTNNQESVQVMVNCAVKIARITKEAHTSIVAKAASS